MLPTDSLYRAQLAALYHDPQEITPRVLVAMALLESGATLEGASSEGAAHEGIKLLRSCLQLCMHEGQPITALWVLNLLKRHAPLLDLQASYDELSSLYARTLPSEVTLPELRSDEELATLEEEARQRALELSEQYDRLKSLSGRELERQVSSVASDLSAFNLQSPSHEGTLPLFSAFSEPVLNQLLNALELRCFAEDDLLIEEGEESDGVFLICYGEVSISRRDQEGETVDLATVGAGSLIGEMGLITNSPRVATVSACDEVWALMLPAPAYALMKECHEEVYAALSHLVGGRMLENLTRFSPIFRAIPRASHAELLREFKSMIAQPGEVLLQQGKRGRGLFLILDGLIRVTQLGTLEPRWLREGDIFGETSLVYDSPVTATCTAVRRSLLFALSPERFKRLLEQHPEIRESLSELSLFRNLDGLYTLT